MNIFWLDNNPIVSAQNHMDKHVVKMSLEYCQILCTAHRVVDGEYWEGNRFKHWDLSKYPDGRERKLWRASHVNHPSCIWVRESVRNYFGLYFLWSAVLDEYTFRYGKIHKSSELKSHLVTLPLKLKSNSDFTNPPLVMPEEYQIEGNVIESYRNYYIHSKSHLAKWSKREKPFWYHS